MNFFKYTFLICFLWSLCCNAQEVNPLEQLPLPTGKVKSVTCNNYLYQDSMGQAIKTGSSMDINFYNRKGFLIKYSSYDSGKLERTTVYSYKDTFISDISTYNSKKELIEKYAYERPSKDLLTINHYRNGKIEETIKSTYSLDSKVGEEKRYTGEGKLYFVCKNYFNERQQLIRKEIFDSTGLKAEDVYKHNDKSKLLAIISKNGTQKLFHYDTAGYLTEYLELLPNKVEKMKKSYTYNSKGMLSHVDISFDRRFWDLQSDFSIDYIYSAYDYEYDDNGNLIKFFAYRNGSKKPELEKDYTINYY